MSKIDENNAYSSLIRYGKDKNRKITIRVDDRTDLILSELAQLCGSEKSAIIRALITMQFDKIVDEKGNILDAKKKEIESAL